MASILKVSQLQKPDGSTPTAADLGIDVAGSVVQVVQNLQAGDISISSSAVNDPNSASWTSTGISASITPKYADSKILVSVMFKCAAGNGAGAPGNPYFGGRISADTGSGYSVLQPTGSVYSGSEVGHFNISPDRADGSQDRDWET